MGEIFLGAKSLLKGRERLVAKMNIILFYGKWGFEYFFIWQFYGIIFRENVEKKFWVDMTIF